MNNIVFLFSSCVFIYLFLIFFPLQFRVLSFTVEPNLVWGWSFEPIGYKDMIDIWWYGGIISASKHLEHQKSEIYIFYVSFFI